MITARPSLQGRFTLVWSGDSALQPKPEDAEGVKEWDHAFKVAGETGAWAAITKAGDTPTYFAFELPNGTGRRQVIDRIDELVRGRGAQLAAYLFSVAIKEVSNLGDQKVVMVKGDDGLDRCDDALVAFLDGINPSIISELGYAVLNRTKGPSPKS